MPKIFISYRRGDTGGHANHLADDLRKFFGKDNVFIDIDTIRGGVDFEERIEEALDQSRVTFALIGHGWLTAAVDGGTRRLDDDDDPLRREIAAALAREDVTMVPVLVEGASMPGKNELPSDIASLAKQNAMELSNKRWRYDVRQLCRVASEHDRWWQRWRRGRIRRYAMAALVTIAAVAALALALAGKGGTTASGSCGDTSLDAGTTTCEFAENVEKVYDAGPGGSLVVSAYSPRLQKYIRMRCKVEEAKVHCTGGKNASVSFPRR